MNLDHIAGTSSTYRRLEGRERVRMRAALADGYEEGASIRVLADQYDLSYGLTHTLLREARIKFRGRGGRPSPIVWPAHRG